MTLCSSGGVRILLCGLCPMSMIEDYHLIVCLSHLGRAWRQDQWFAHRFQFLQSMIGHTKMPHQIFQQGAVPSRDVHQSGNLSCHTQWQNFCPTYLRRVGELIGVPKRCKSLLLHCPCSCCRWSLQSNLLHHWHIYEWSWLVVRAVTNQWLITTRHPLASLSCQQGHVSLGRVAGIQFYFGDKAYANRQLMDLGHWLREHDDWLSQSSLY